MFVPRCHAPVPLAALLVWAASSALAQNPRPWVDPPASLADPPPKPGESKPRALPVPEATPSRPEPAARVSKPAPASPTQVEHARPAPDKPARMRSARRPPRLTTERQLVAPVPPSGVKPVPPSGVEQGARVARARPAASPSFNCRYARTAVEQAICEIPTLADKDRRMARLYEQAGGSRYGPVDPSQWRWLAARNACGRAGGRALEACVNRVYDARIAELSGRGY